MHFWHNITIRMSWTLVLVTFLALLLALSLTGLYAIDQSRDSIAQLTRINVSQQAALNRTNSTLQSARTSLADFYQKQLEQRPDALPRESRRAQAEEVRQQLEHAESDFQAFMALPADARHNALIAPIAQRFEQLMSRHLRPQLEALGRGDITAYRQARADAQRAYDAFYQAAIGFFHTVENQGSTLLERFDTVINRSIAAIVGVFVFALIVTALVYWGVGANLIRPIRRVIEHFNVMARGDLSHPVESLGNNEVGQLFAALGHMRQGLLETVSSVRESGQEVYDGASDIARGNQELSARTERQSASLTQTASSMEEMTSTMERSSDNATRANRVAEEAAASAEQGSQVVRRVVERMQDIRQGSREITEIITLIDSIAFQTNILALNASVEAARAGEQGRGFAVVANEVRQLATRSASAATDIRQRIDTSVSQVEAGAEQADLAGETMRDIITAIGRVTTLMDEIDVATREQRSGIQEINSAVNDMEQTTQQNAAMVLQASTAAQQLQGEAERLNQVVARFVLPDNAEETLPAPAGEGYSTPAPALPAF